LAIWNSLCMENRRLGDTKWVNLKQLTFVLVISPDFARVLERSKNKQ
jgi:hypothetical protein